MLKNRIVSLNSRDLYTRLSKIHTTLCVAEIHGLVTGVVCAGVCANGRSWVEAVLGLLHPRAGRQHTSRRVLIDLYYFISEQLSNGGALFTLFLPDPVEDLTERAVALTDWCTGFLSGLRLFGLTDYHEFNEATSDALYHCTEIAELDFDGIECAQDDSLALEHTMEYVRMTAILVFDALCGGQITGLQAYQHYQMQLLSGSEEVMH